MTRTCLFCAAVGAWLLLVGGAAGQAPAEPAQTEQERTGQPGDNAPAPDRADVCVVVGAAGEPDYAARFQDWAEQWREASRRAGADLSEIGPASPAAADADPPPRERLRQRLAQLAGESERPLWLVLIGHGTFDGRVAKFNLPGPDVSADELADWLSEVKRPVAVLVCCSSSAPFLNRLSAPGRIVVTATKSGDELNYSRFGGFLAEAVGVDSADLDKDGQTSLLEAYLLAAKRTAQFYADEGRLATEHALLDDNGDGLGTPAEWFRGVRATQAPAKGELDGLAANQWHLVRSAEERDATGDFRRRRDELERQIETLRRLKGELSEDDYYERLEPLLVELARLYDEG